MSLSVFYLFHVLFALSFLTVAASINFCSFVVIFICLIHLFVEARVAERFTPRYLDLKVLASPVALFP